MRGDLIADQRLCAQSFPILSKMSRLVAALHPDARALTKLNGGVKNRECHRQRIQFPDRPRRSFVARPSGKEHPIRWPSVLAAPAIPDSDNFSSRAHRKERHICNNRDRHKGSSVVRFLYGKRTCAPATVASDRVVEGCWRRA